MRTPAWMVVLTCSGCGQRFDTNTPLAGLPDASEAAQKAAYELVTGKRKGLLGLFAYANCRHWELQYCAAFETRPPGRGTSSDQPAEIPDDLREKVSDPCNGSIKM
mmetsp:Transcript_17069/g.49483  ORF Transcript_17069/g.49483 Transcript_17069/m.49483 type:complete len:106 (-) Transcript_17069:145-462(-)